SIVTTHRPRAAWKPASVAAVSPAFALSRTRRTRASLSRNPRMISALWSWLPSSTKTTSQVRSSVSSTPRSSAHSVDRFSSSLNVGMTTESSSTWMRALPLRNERLGEVQPIENTAHGVIDDVVKLFRAVVERRHRGQDDGAHLGERQHHLEMA